MANPVTADSPIHRATPDLPRNAWIVVALLAVALMINYIDRSNMSVAAPMLKTELGLNEAQLGLLLSAFFWTYALALPVIGWLVHRVSAGVVLAIGFLVWSLATSVTGFLHGFLLMFAARLLLGLGESVFYPAFGKILADIIPLKRLGSANAFVMGCQSLGPAFGIFAGGLLMARFGWRPFFIALGLASLLWLLPWLRYMPRGSEHEAASVPPSPSLWNMLRRRSLWGTVFGLFCGNYTWYFLLTWMPYYVVHERGLSADEMAKLGGIAFVGSAAANFFMGWLTDRWIASGASHTLIRKATLGVGYVAAGVLLVLCATASGRSFAPLLIAATMCIGGCGFCIFAVGQTIAGPSAAGKWVGIQNGFANFAGVAASAVTGFVAHKTGHFLAAFVLTCGVALFGAISWVLIVGKVEPLDWSS